MNFRKKPVSLAVAGALTISANAAFSQGMLEEVVVTAQKRESAVSDLGLAVTAFTGDTMRALGMDQPVDLAAQTPGLVIQNTMGDGQPAVMIRGVGINDFNTNTNPGVAVYVDEVAKPIPAMLGFSLFDMDRVEVLKGPQGTLYGQNTTGGAVSFYTKQPTEELTGYIQGDVGDYDYGRLEAGISGPISDSVRYRLSGYLTKQDEGYQTDLITGDDHGQVDRKGFRAQLAVDFSDNVDGLLSYTYGKDASESQVTRVADGLEVYQAYYYTFFPGSQDDIGHYDILLGANESEFDNKSDALNLRINADLGAVTLTSVTGYDEMDHLNKNPFPGTELRIQNASYGGELESFSQEFRLANNEGDLVDWIVGLYYSKVEQDNSSKLDYSDGFGFLFYYYGLTTGLDDVVTDTAYTQELETMAVFAHTEWNLSDQFKLTVGARYAQDKLEYDVDTSSPTPACSGSFCDVIDLYYGLTDYDSAFSTFLNISDGGVVDGPRQDGVFATAADSVDEDSFTWRLALDWTPNDNTLLYASVSEGSKAHGFYGGVAVTSPAYDAYNPEELTAYELGFKLSLADSTLQLDGAVYYYDYQDQQLIVSFDPGIGLPNDNLTNIAESEVTGAELDLTWAPVEGLTTRFTAAWLDTELKDGTVSSPLPIFPGSEPVEGEDLAFAPEFTFSGLVRYDFNISGNLGAFVQVDGDYVDNQLALAARRDTELDSRTVYNARFGLQGSDGTWEASIWGRNLGDEEYSTYRYVSLPGTFNNHIGAPRTYGLTLRYNFGAL